MLWDTSATGLSHYWVSPTALAYSSSFSQQCVYTVCLRASGLMYRIGNNQLWTGPAMETLFRGDFSLYQVLYSALNHTSFGMEIDNVNLDLR